MSDQSFKETPIATQHDHESKPTRQRIPPLGKLRELVGDYSYANFVGSSSMRFIAPVQLFFTYILLNLRVSATQTTVLWLVVSYVAYGIMTIGQPWAFVAGAILIYISIALDGSDGEIARYNKQFMTDEEDAVSFVHGVYLDEVFHSIQKPFWGLSIGVGLFWMMGEPLLALVSGISVSVYHSFCRHSAAVVPHTISKFRNLIAKVSQDGGFRDLDAISNDKSTKDPFVIRVMDKLEFWTRNGKRFNLMILVLGLIDSSLWLAGFHPVAVYWGFVSIAMVCPVLIIYVIARTVASRKLIFGALQSADASKWRQN